MCVKVCLFLFTFCLYVDLPGATEIDCILMRDCPMAMELLRTKKYAPETIKFFRSSFCGTQGRMPMIFCPKWTSCSTQFVRNGTCAHVHNCKPLQNIMRDFSGTDQEMRLFLQNNRCYSEYDDDFRVCCPPEDDFWGTTTTERFYLPSEMPEDRLLFDGPISSDGNLPDLNRGECGVQVTGNNKITGGTTTELEEFPWMALLVYEVKNGYKNGCGGSLISSKYVITAAHCLVKEIYKKFKLNDLKFVLLGEYNTNNVTDCIFGECSDPPLRILVKSTLVHPKFTYPNALNDIGLIELDRPVKFTDYIRPICLPNKSFTLRGNETFEVAGWGQTYTKPSSDVKLKARVKFAPPEKCKRVNDKIATSKGQICAGKGDGKDTCKGDSGGPLMLGRVSGSEYVYMLVGITSYGLTNCGTGPSVYTYVPTYYDWIKSNVR